MGEDIPYRAVEKIAELPGVKYYVKRGLDLKYPMPYLILPMFVLLLSCNSDRGVYYSESNAKEYETKLELIDSGKRVFHLDSTINPSSFSYIDFYRDGENSFIMFISSPANAICIFDYESGYIVKKIPLALEGPDAVHSLSMFDGLMRIDSAHLLYLNHSQGKLYVLDDKAHVLNDIDLDREIEKLYGHSQVGIIASNWWRMIGDENLVIFSAYPFKGTGKYATQYSTLSLNFNDMSIEAFSTYPDIFDRAYWGYHSFIWIASPVISNEDELYLSYTIDPFIYQEDPTQTTDPHGFFVGSKYFEEIAPQSYDISRNEMPEGRTGRGNEDYFTALNFFYGMVYDPFRELYYRLVRLGKKNPGDKVEFSLIVMNTTLEKIYEEKLSEFIDPFSFFISEEGILFYNPYTTDKKEFEAVFDLYVFKEE